MPKLNIVADQNMPLVQELFAEYGNVRLLPGRDISAADLQDADVLLVRSVTQVNQQLLAGSPVKFVGSATIGTDHIDLGYLEQSDIQFSHAPGCNAEAVVQYDLSVMCRLMPDWQEKKVGIVGCGNVGGRLYKRLQDLGVSCAVYDPFLSRADIPDLGELEAVLDCDIICLHTPITAEGEYPTHHLLDMDRLRLIKPDALLINAGRGAVIDNRALLALFRGGSTLQVALDVWETEPHIDVDLMSFVAMATPHIAGYSLEGKVNGTGMVFDAFRVWADLVVTEKLQVADPMASMASRDESSLLLEPESLNEAILDCYDVAMDDERMRDVIRACESAGLEKAERALAFDRLRKEYPVRREFSHYRVDLSVEGLAQYLSLGFVIA